MNSKSIVVFILIFFFQFTSCLFPCDCGETVTYEVEYDIKDIPIDTFYTDDWGSYSKYLPKEKHIIGKVATRKIERKNLNFRTHIKRLNRKTICFSKNEQVHDNVIGMSIEKYYYKYGKFGDFQSI